MPLNNCRCECHKNKDPDPCLACASVHGIDVSKFEPQVYRDQKRVY